MDVSPALNGCLGYALDGEDDRVDWRFLDDHEVPAGPWTTLVTTSGLTEQGGVPLCSWQGGTMHRRMIVAAGVATTAAIALGGCSLLGDTTVPMPSRSRTPHASATATPHSAGDDVVGSATPVPLVPSPGPTPSPSPTLTQIAAGTPVAEGDVTSPKGSVHYHYRIVADGDGTFSTQFSGFTSTLPVPVSVTLLGVAPRVGDGLTDHGTADHQLGGPTSGAAPASSVALDGVGHDPSGLGTIVTYSSAPASAAATLPVEIGPDKVLAVDTVRWSIPVRQSNVHPVDGGAGPYAYGVVTATTASGAPRTYLVAHGDRASVVAERFGVSVADLVFLNADIRVFGDDQWMYEGTSINLDPDRLDTVG
ncbi:LysM domain-containing protein [Curtobacterium sp. RRHDQ10]|uniref:LysM domain-containing protein n=1 Tax=Curtobacterium phyllosphaerae TaxID=3413379 RepID=UPI003BF3FBFA